MLSTGHQKKSLRDLRAINDKEFEELLLDFVKNENNSEIKSLTELDPDIFFPYAEAHPEINSLLDSHNALQENWHNILLSADYPAFIIKSCDGKTTLSPFSQIKGMTLLNAMRESSNLDDANTATILNRACEIGMFDALLKRLRFNINKVKEPAKLPTYLDAIFADAEKIRNLYWSYGCVMAGLELLGLANHLMQHDAVKINNERFFMFGDSKFSWINSYNNANLPPFVLIVEVAVEYFYLAIELARFDMSNQIEKAMADENGLFAILGGYNNVESFEKALLTKLDEYNIPRKNFFCEKAREAAKKLANEYQSLQQSIRP